MDLCSLCFRKGGFYFVSVTSFVGRLQCQHVPLCIALNPRPGIGVVFAVCLKVMWIPKGFAVRYREGYTPHI